jgi:hypothetical protein
MNKYETIIANLELGFHQPVKNEEGQYLMFSPFKDEHGNYRTSNWCDTLREVKQNLCGCNFGGCSDGKIETESPHWTLLEPIHFPPKKAVKAGEKVLIMSNAESECGRLGYGWNIEKEAMVGKVLEVRDLMGRNINIWNKDKSDYLTFPITAICYPINEEKREDIIEIDGAMFTGKIWENINIIKVNGIKYKKIDEN